MTIVEIKLSNAIEALEAGKLNDYEASFVEKIKDFSKKELKNLSSKQYNFLRSIAEKR